MRIARVFNRIGLLLLLTNERAKGKVVNVGNPEEVTILRARASCLKGLNS